MDSNQIELSKATLKILLHIKEHSWKLCRKGLLERGLKDDVMVGSFKQLENEFMKRVAEPEINYDDVVADLKEKKTKCMNTELLQLKTQLCGLDITIGNIRKDIASKIKEKTLVEKWTKRINESTKNFTKMFSKNNDLMFTMSKNHENTMRDIMYELNFISKSDYYKTQTKNDNSNISFSESNDIKESDVCHINKKMRYNDEESADECCEGFIEIDEVGDIDLDDFSDFMKVIQNDSENYSE